MANILTLEASRSDHQVSAFSHESEVRSYCRSIDAVFVSASGSHVTDALGRSYIDFLAGCAALNYGHNDPDMAVGLTEYIGRGGVAHGLDLHTEAKARFIDAFQRLILSPRDLSYRLQFTGPTGTNAVEAALKLARKITGRSQVVAFTRGFHGVTMGALAATGNRGHRMAEAVQLPGVTRAYYDGFLGAEIDTAQILEQALNDPSSGFDKPAAILLETVQGEGGLSAASEDWLKSIAAIAERHGALLIVDDIQAGCGRTGSFFSFESMGITPDIVTLSKSLSGFGLPMSLVLIKPEHDKWTPGEHNGTFRGNNLAFVTAAIALEKFWASNHLTADVARRSEILAGALQKMTPLIPGSFVKGRGMMIGLDTKDGELASAITGQCYQDGLLIETSGSYGEVVKVLAPLTTPDEVLLEGLEILSSAISKTVVARQSAGQAVT